MNYKTIIVILLFLLPISNKVFATVDYLVVNHITKELYWAETDNGPGFIGWKTIPEGKWESAENSYLKSGYKMTGFPFKIELGIIAGLVIAGLGLKLFINKQ